METTIESIVEVDRQIIEADWTRRTSMYTQMGMLKVCYYREEAGVSMKLITIFLEDGTYLGYEFGAETKNEQLGSLELLLERARG